MTHAQQQVLLASGECLEVEEVYEALLLLARAQAEFPVITERDAQTALALLMIDALEHNAEAHII